jgi:hypothetical protein
LHQALHRLNERGQVSSQPQRLPICVTATPVTGFPAALLGVSIEREEAVREFADRVRATLVSELVISYEARKNLIRIADRLKIERFHANLVIAALSHEVARRAITPAIDSTPSKGGLILAAVATQGLISAVAILLYITL